MTRQLLLWPQLTLNSSFQPFDDFSIVSDSYSLIFVIVYLHYINLIISALVYFICSDRNPPSSGRADRVSVRRRALETHRPVDGLTESA